MELPCLIVREALRRENSSKHVPLVCEPAGRRFTERGEATLFPSFKQLRVKSVSPSGRNRVRVLVKGVPERLLVPGSVIVEARAGVYRGRVGYALPSVEVPEGRYALRGGLYWGCPLSASVTIERVGSALRIVAREELPLVPGGKYELFPVAGGGPHVAELILVLPVEPGPRAHRRIEQSLARLTPASPRAEIYRVLLELAGWVEALPDFDALPELGGVRVGESCAARPELLERVRARLAKLVRAAGGVRIREHAVSLGVSEHFAEAVAAGMTREGLLRHERGVLLPPFDQLPLSPVERQTLEALRERGVAGRPIGSIGRGPDRTLFSRLDRFGAVTLIGGRYLHRDVVERLERTVAESVRPGARVSVADVRSVTGLAAPGALDLLDRLESKGEMLRLSVGWKRVAHAGARRR